MRMGNIFLLNDTLLYDLSGGNILLLEVEFLWILIQFSFTFILCQHLCCLGTDGSSATYFSYNNKVAWKHLLQDGKYMASETGENLIKSSCINCGGECSSRI